MYRSQISEFSYDPSWLNAHIYLQCDLHTAYEITVWFSPYVLTINWRPVSFGTPFPGKSIIITISNSIFCQQTCQFWLCSRYSVAEINSENVQCVPTALQMLIYVRNSKTFIYMRDLTMCIYINVT